ncbi:MAG: magnesium transporter [Deltaproteobacteria bacterium]|jgi:magnesium transporter|nr:magnesium transporter [Deltaproteobacteria bacterium]
MNEIESQEVSLVARLLESWPHLSSEDRLQTFRGLSADDSEDLFLALDPRSNAGLFIDFNRAERRLWIRFLAPDDAADLIQELPESYRPDALQLIDEKVRREIIALLSYREDEAGGLMSPRFVRVRPDMLVAEALRYVRQQALIVDPIHYVYVLDSSQRLMGVMSLRQLFVSAAEKKISDVMQEKVVTVPDEMDQEHVSRIFQQQRFVALPVIDREGRMQGIVTVDDILDVSQEEATEDIHKMGGQEALDAPYPQVPLKEMVRKRAGWLMLLFVGGMFTTTAMERFQNEIEKAVVLSLFIPLIISSGGNVGSQATTLIIRSLALGELRLTDWSKVLVKEIITGLSLGGILACVGFLRIVLWPNASHHYTEHFHLVGIAVAISLVGVVLFGSVVGAMLPFILRRLRLDPASASAPFVATLVDVTGLVIYFSVARVLLRNALL